MPLIASCKPLIHSSRTQAPAPPVTVLTPDVIGNMSLWLDGSKGITHVQSRASSWADQSGNGNNAVQLTGTKQPLVINDQWGTAIQVGGADIRNMTLPTISLSPPYTLFAVIKHGSPGPTGTYNVMFTNTSATGYLIVMNSAVPASIKASPIPGRKLSQFYTGGLDIGVPYTFESGTVTSIFSHRLKVRDIIYPDSPYVYPSFPASGFASLSTLIADLANNTTSNIYEVVVFTSELSATQAGDMEFYFKNKYSLGF